MEKTDPVIEKLGPQTMNYRVVILSGITCALVGSVFGWGVGQIALRQHSSQMKTYMSQPYQMLYGRRFIWIGAVVGFAIGAGQASILSQRHHSDDDQR
ncbi:MAG: hypothetical protein RLZZ490_2264 [Cyanobacteriota bacterium]|jgi:hypothetical protein